MAEEIKQEENKCGCVNNSSVIFKVIVGLVFLGLGFALVIIWWPELLRLVKGCAGLFLILAGIVTLAVAKE